ncbi:RnfABCDGE type electron transport complex subunit G [Proteiniborus sp. MB09-C3]|uniref:RnfABCDGE type electron transport complex subunit G n=1 Tax=Proteiniborus sp. MB09-C3 TaxID=3050072 RepID=UPI002555D3D5|nr:RnfABCDGE type electron transport complex subunit G [Proteiniborus sp. MB09-C3]WIV10576.1 RnfABCDGE type electron transport complex subunit G [Proteiniborus sp. MB09-C3]
MREIVKLGLILFLITAIAAALLAFANDATSELIAQVQEQESNKARQEVLPSAENFVPLDENEFNKIIAENNRIKEIYIGKNSADELVGYTVKTTASGYGGNIEIITGISEDGKVTGMKVVSHSETPGLGANSTKPEFQDQFVGKSVSSNISVVKSAPNDSDIQAISGATITSKAVSSGVNMAIDVFNGKLAK